MLSFLGSGFGGMMTSRFPRLLLLVALLLSVGLHRAATCKESEKAIIVIHGGAGVEKGLSQQQMKEYQQGLDEALLAAYKARKEGREAVDVVEVAVRMLEDNPLFNAGRGAVFTREGKNELDAAIMDGATRKAGAVAGVTVVKNPITEAIAVMRKSPHVMLVGEGANQFARQEKLEIVDPKYFFTKTRWDDLQRKLNEEKGKHEKKSQRLPDHRYGTVGCVVVDNKGNLAAGTSTGGLTGKRWGRVGDSPVIGAGTFADNTSCAVSCTGEGEWFIRYTVASDLAARVKYLHQSVADAADELIHKVLGPGRGEGGLIVLDKAGNFAMPFNSDGMFRGYIGEDGVPHSFIY